MTALDAARAIAAAWPVEATVSPETGLPVCVETVHHVVEGFRRAGVREARPLVVELAAYNRPATARVLGDLSDEEAPGAVVLRVGPVSSARAQKENGDRRGWPGHLVVDHPDFILDLVLPGVVRAFAGQGFEALGPFCGEKRNELLDVDGTWMAMTEDGLCLRFEPMPRVASFRNTTAWRWGVDDEVVGQLADAVRRHL